MSEGCAVSDDDQSAERGGLRRLAARLRGGLKLFPYQSDLDADAAAAAVERLLMDAEKAERERNEARLERDEAQARVESHALRTMDALKRAQKAEQERNEARRSAERIRDRYGGMETFPWEREEVGG